MRPIWFATALHFSASSMGPDLFTHQGLGFGTIVTSWLTCGPDIRPVLGFFFLYFRHPSNKMMEKMRCAGGNNARACYRDSQGFSRILISCRTPAGLYCRWQKSCHASNQALLHFGPAGKSHFCCCLCI